jgi:hypothetical protein
VIRKEDNRNKNIQLKMAHVKISPCGIKEKDSRVKKTRLQNHVVCQDTQKKNASIMGETNIPCPVVCKQIHPAG